MDNFESFFKRKKKSKCKYNAALIQYGNTVYFTSDFSQKKKIQPLKTEFIRKNKNKIKNRLDQLSKEIHCWMWKISETVKSPAHSLSNLFNLLKFQKQSLSFIIVYICFFFLVFPRLKTNIDENVSYFCLHKNEMKANRATQKNLVVLLRLLLTWVISFHSSSLLFCEVSSSLMGIMTISLTRH